METSLHRQLKSRYACDDDSTEVVVEGFRIDAIDGTGELIEVQHASLSAIRRKARQLLQGTTHRLRIVKPIVCRKRVTTLTRRGGKLKRSRMSPLRGEAIELFLDLVHFTQVFPAPRLTLEFVLIEAEEVRVDRARKARRRKRYQVLDQRLVEVIGSVELRSAGDLLSHVPLNVLPKPFDTAELGAAMGRPRWFAQKVAYCLRETAAVSAVGKRRNSLLYLPTSHASTASQSSVMSHSGPQAA